MINVLCLFLERVPKISKVDLAFAITATSSTAEESFGKMKETINDILNQLGQRHVKYGLIVFGTSAAIKVNFKDNFTKDDDLRKFINSVPRSRGRPDFAKALREAKNLFDDSGRPEAKKVLILITDAKSSNSMEDIKTASVSLEASVIRVISIAVGDESDSEELEAITPLNKDLLVSDEDELSPQLAKKIMNRLVKGSLLIPTIKFFFLT